MVASSRGHYDVVRLLLEKGALVDFCDCYGKSALMLASEKGRCKVVELLLDKGAQMNLKDNFGRSAITVASKNWHCEVVDFLIEKGAQASFEDEVGCQALLQLACRGGKIQLSRWIIGKLSSANLGSSWESVLENSLNLAFSYGHHEIIKLLLEKVFSGNLEHYGKDSVVSACLEHACRGGRYDMVTLMIERGAVVGAMALKAASEGGHYDMVKLLLEWKGGVDKFDDGGGSALRAACTEGYYRIVKLLLKLCTDIECVNIVVEEKLVGSAKLESALTCATKGGHFNVVKLLLDEGAKTRLHLAVTSAMHFGTAEMVELFLVRFSEKDHDGRSPLMHASDYGLYQMVKLLLEKGALVDVQDSNGRSALMFTKEHKIAKLLLDNGAQIDLQDKYGFSALIFASVNGLCEMAKLLLDKGAQVDLQDSHDRSALMSIGYHYCDKIDTDVVCKPYHCPEEKLIHLPIYSTSYTLYHQNCLPRHMKVVKLLLERGAQVSLIDEESCPGLLWLTCGIGNFQVSKSILSVCPLASLALPLLWDGGVIEACVEHACASGHLEVVKLLLEYGAMVGCGNALTGAAKGGHLEVVKLLLDKDAHVSYSALTSAMEHGHYKVVEVFLESCAHEDLLDDDGCSPLMFASKHGLCEMAKLLLEKGAQVDLQDSHGMSALMIASCYEVALLLLEKGAQVNMRDSDGRCALMLAGDKFWEVVNVFGSDSLPFISAIKNSLHFQVGELLLENGAQFYYENDYDGCLKLLLLVCRSGNLNAIQAILPLHAYKKPQLELALALACFGGHHQIITLLLGKGALCFEEYSTLALLCASAMGHCDVVQLLLDRGLSVYVEDGTGMSAIMLACQSGHRTLVSFLLVRGAEVNRLNQNGNYSLVRMGIARWLNYFWILVP